MFFLTTNGRNLMFSFCLVLFAVCAANAQIFNGPGFQIVDGGGRTATSCSTIPVTGITSNVLLRSVSLNNFSHGWIGDLEARVYPPSVAPPSQTGSFILTSPPDNVGCNTLGTYRFIDSAAQSIDAASVGCTTNQIVPAGDYRTSNYGGGGTTPGAVTNLTTFFGSLTPAQANGNWSVCVFDFLTPDGGGMNGTSLDFAVVTAAQASISGRVVGLEGRGITGIKIILTDSTGNSRTATTNSFGMYNFDEVEVGGTYVVNAAHKRYQFQNPTQVLSVSENVSGLNFVVIE